MHKFTALEKMAATKRGSTIAIAAADDPSILKAVKNAVDQQLASFLLYGDIDRLKRFMKEEGLSEDRITCIHASTADRAADMAIEAWKSDKADLLMKGIVSTDVLAGKILKDKSMIKSGSILSQLAIFDIPSYHKLLFLTDAGINIAPSIEVKKKILTNAVSVFYKMLHSAPKVAVLAATEKVNPAMPATTDAALLTVMQQRGQLEHCQIDGPLALDAALSAQSAATKKIDSAVAGDTDILLVPEIESGNMLYKSFTYAAGAVSASLLVGTKTPVILTSRADDSTSKYYAICFALAAASLA
ncbi:phosphate butyryltransferase [Terribacillus halophilus]|uniref:Phosphate butyryltransferase n=1 Tax=Terribacillus halophilus TaxID=361279 RepID=A0A1G6UVA4_9BACI|nr:phosphate acyltransferase [Terribacillus halophilus]SDD44547.1 phosphate butyryltransferase [Terribacillus halophilus]